MKSIFQHAPSLSVHLLLCALLACVAFFSTGVPAQASAVSVHQQPVLLQVDAWAHVINDIAPTAPIGAFESITADMAGDLPELLLATMLPVAPTTRFDRQVQHPLYALSHPFHERPQRPPRLITRHA